MSCNSCTKSYTLFRKEKGCPSCGFSYCSNCLSHKIFVQKLNRETKVCPKCKHGVESSENQKIEPPDAYYKRLGAIQNSNATNPGLATKSLADQEIEARLNSLKAERHASSELTTNDEIEARLKLIKGPQPTTSDAELQARLANLKGVPIVDSPKMIILTPKAKTEQEQADELLKDYLEKAEIDKKYKEGFDAQIKDIESRVQQLKGAENSNSTTRYSETQIESEDEEEVLKNIIEKVKAESLLEYEETITSPTNDELPFCEICNEDAKMRCLGCKYLFCKRCFLEHKDDDDGCDKFEEYKPKEKNS